MCHVDWETQRFHHHLVPNAFRLANDNGVGVGVLNRLLRTERWMAA